MSTVALSLGEIGELATRASLTNGCDAANTQALVRTVVTAIAREVMQKDPFSNTCFLFTNKRYTALKILAWDINGFSLWSKVIESR